MLHTMAEVGLTLFRRNMATGSLVRGDVAAAYAANRLAERAHAGAVRS